ncbi:MAG: NAD(P)H-dependent oxidoreductase [Sphingobacteriales bacterium]|nr:MAG: NAD(P)H-dependent oxidoreductase [Sphingobacteriales bacterium]
MFNLKIIITSTRPGRKSPAFANWIAEEGKKHSDFNISILDLGAINLPFFDEPVHPIAKQYQHQHTKDWAAMVDDADAFIIVTPEYNYGFTAVFKNAIDYLHHEWKHKPVGILSYGGVSAGTRAAQMMKQVLTTLSMTPLSEAVSVPMFFQFFDEEGNFTPNEELNKAADVMYTALHKWTTALKPMRA